MKKFVGFSFIESVMIKRTLVKVVFPTVKNENKSYARINVIIKKNNCKVSYFFGLGITISICSFFSYTL